MGALHSSLWFEVSTHQGEQIGVSAQARDGRMPPLSIDSKIASIPLMMASPSFFTELAFVG
jgi:hypothetical protein